MINDYTISTAAEEPDASSKNSDQNFEESLSKNMNSEDPNFSLDPDNDRPLGEISMNTKSKKKGPYKNLLNNHDVGLILHEKRSRRHNEPTADGEKTPHEPPHLNSKRRFGELHGKGRAMHRQNSKLHSKSGVKVDRKLNKIFVKGTNVEETAESSIDTKEVFENYYKRLKKRIEVISHSLGDKIVPETNIVIEQSSQCLPSNNDEILAISLNREKEDRHFIINRNMCQKTRDFDRIEELDVLVNTFPREEPSLRKMVKLDKVESLQKKLAEIPDKVVNKVIKKPNNKNKVDENANPNDNLIYIIPSDKHSHTYINCDLRYFNFDFLVEKVGYFDVILMDPPWKEYQQEEPVTDAPNNKLCYDTLSHQEIMNLPIDRISFKGFIFMWIPPSQLNVAYEMMGKWGYEVVDQIIWVKLKDSKVHLSPGSYFMHSFEMCLLGMKNPSGEHVEYNSKVSNNIIFSEVRKKGQKPEELYEIIDLLMPGAKKIELFAKNHNLRHGWFSLGNQLGDEYGKWFNSIGCNRCNQTIPIGVRRYKARYEPNYDLCENCFQSKVELDKDDFFIMSNSVTEDVLHYYHSCSNCHTEPIWGTRFTCLDCENFDLCEACFDLNLQSEVRFHDIRHNIHALEIPIQAYGLSAHAEKKCCNCSQKPIVGICYTCTQCPDLNWCQNCYFTQNPEDMKQYINHKPYHNVEVVPEPEEQEYRPYKCSWCEVNPIQGPTYKCENCFNYYFCEKCYLKRDSFRSNNTHSHKFYHAFTMLNTDS